MNNIPFENWTEQRPLFDNLTSLDIKSIAPVDRAVPVLFPAETIDPITGLRKMPIPRLGEGGEAPYTSPGRFHRRHVSRACESCRQRKTKCTGDRSGCRNCREANILCCYTDGKREKSKRQLASLEAKLEHYEAAFNSLSRRHNMSSEQLMALATSSDAIPDQASRSFIADGQNTPPMSGNPCSSSYTAEDFNKDENTRATGFIGEASEISWLHKLAQELGNSGDYGGPSASISSQSLIDPLNHPISKSSYHLDDLDMPTPDELDAYQLPSKDAAWCLCQVYLGAVHPTFPIIATSTFCGQVQSFYSDLSSVRPGSKWLAILNLIFAISTKYCHLTGAKSKYETDDHYTYFARARVLGLENRTFVHAELQQLQVEGLASLYLLSTGQVNRAWKLCGDAVRAAMSLGLHLRSYAPSVPDTMKEIRYRMWWSLYTMEHRLSVMTGRPSLVADGDCTAPLPVPFEERDFGNENVMRQIQRSPGPSRPDGLSMSTSLADQDMHSTVASSNSFKLGSGPVSESSYFIELIKLVSIAKKMMSKLYSAEEMKQPLESKQFTMRGLIIEIDAWCMKLPKEFDFTSTSTPTKTSRALSAQRMSLALLFYSTKIGITRPFLDIPGSPYGDENAAKASDSAQNMAVECVEAACHVLRLFPDPPEAAALYEVTPWWCVLHFLMQATAIIYLECRESCRHVPVKRLMITKAALKSFEWLSVLSKNSASSERARKQCELILGRLGIDPALSRKADSFMAHLPSGEATQDEEESPSKHIPTGSSSPLPQSANLTNASTVESSSLALGSPGALDVMQADKLLSSQNPFGDDYLPYDPSTGHLTGSFFPAETGANNDLDFGYYWDGQM